MCGENDHSDDGSDCSVVGVNHLFARQADMAPLASLVPEQIAERQAGAWQIIPTVVDVDSSKKAGAPPLDAAGQGPDPS